MRQNPAFLAFNRGLVSTLALARVDQKRIGMSARRYDNWIPKVLGPMGIRPGLGYLGGTFVNAKAFFLEFIYALNDTALVEVTNQTMRVWVNDAIVNIVAVATAITNGVFGVSGGIASWTVTGGVTYSAVAPGCMAFVSDGTTIQSGYQTVNVAAPDVGKEHTLYIAVQHGPIQCRIGAHIGTDEYVALTTLETGNHALAFFPTTSTFTVQFQSTLVRQVLLTSCVVAPVGPFSLPTPWLTADLPNLRYSQSGNYIFVACNGYAQFRIFRRGLGSASCDLYDSSNGPFLPGNTGPVTLQPSGLNGNITVTASDNTFYAGHAATATRPGAAYQFTAVGQAVIKACAVNTGVFSNAIRVVGVGASRTFNISITGVWVGTVVLQQSIYGSTGPWTDVTGESWTANVATTYLDGLDNQEVWYRIGIEAGSYVSGTANVQINITSGQIIGVFRVLSVTDSKHANCEVLTDLGSTQASDLWAEDQWSGVQGFPTCVAFYNGRLGWAGRDNVSLSVTDDFYLFDPTFVGDAGPISRSLGDGPVDTVQWLLPMQSLLLGGQMKEITCRSDALDSPITPTDFNLKPGSRQGSASVQALAIDETAVFIQRGGSRIFELQPGGYPLYTYTSQHLSALIPEIGLPSIVRMGIQRQPDTRLHMVRSDGTVAMLLFDKLEQVNAFSTISTNGIIEDVVILPGTAGSNEDQVYYVVNRTINGQQKRYLEKWATEAMCTGLNSTCMLADSYIVYQGAAIATLTGLGSLEGQSVCVWADGIDIGTDDTQFPWQQRYTVQGGTLNLPKAYSNIVVGIPYKAQWQSAKPALTPSESQTILNHKGQVNRLGLIAQNIHAKGIQFGPDFTHLDDMPGTEDGMVVVPNSVRATYDKEDFPFPTTWDTDVSICIQGAAPRPATLMALTYELAVAEG